MQAFQPIKPKAEVKKISAIVYEKEEKKVGEAVKELLPAKGKKKKPKKKRKEGEYVGPKKKVFAIRRVSRIKAKKKKKKK